MTRFNRKNERIYDHSCCAICGTGWGASPGAAKQGYCCKPSTCMACGSTVCRSHGLGNGHCPICYVGRLSGWYFSKTACRYKGCTTPAIADDGKWACCPAHVEKRRPGYIAARLEQRSEQWREVDDSRYTPHRY